MSTVIGEAAAEPVLPTGRNKPRRCVVCYDRVAAWTHPRVDFCYRCLPGGPFDPPPCLRCGGTERTTGYAYYCQGLCTRCHIAAPQRVDACRDCLAWGVARTHQWLCWRCHSWRARFPRGTCRICQRPDLPLNPDQACGLCERQMVIHLGETLEQANAGGQQTYLANTVWSPTRVRPGGIRRLQKNVDRQSPPRLRRVEFHPSTHIQLTLFDVAFADKLAQVRRLLDDQRLPDPPDPTMATFLEAAVRDHALRHGWLPSTTSRTQISLRVLQLLQDSPGMVLLATDAIQLRTIGLTATPVIDVATAAGVMLDDRGPTIHAWFDTTTADLPAGIQAELRAWFDVMINGSTTAPRRKPRSHDATRHYLRNAMPALTTWADQGHTTLRDITSADVRAVLPDSGTPRSTMGAGLRAILTVLKARKIIFVNPIARVRTGGHENRDPLPAYADKVREALLSPRTDGALLAALATFHGLRAGELRNLHLTDLADGRLHIRDRTIPLAEPVQVRLTAWLDDRNRQWPNSANPYLFINRGNANRTTPVGGRYLARATGGIPIHVMREDRILHEAHITGGDVRRISDLFGLSFSGALRYLPHPDINDPTEVESTPSSRTQGRKSPPTHPQHHSSPPSTLQ